MFLSRSFGRAERFNQFTSLSSVADILDHVAAYGERPAIRYDDGSTYHSITFEAYNRLVRSTVPFFAGSSQRVIATFCKNRPELDMVALSVLYTANILLPLDTKTNDVELVHLLRLSPPEMVLTTFLQRERIGLLCNAAGIAPQFLIADLYQVMEDAGAPFGPDHLRAGDIGMSGVVASADQTVPLSASRLLDDPQTVLAHYPTSGTTALPKVVRICHGAIVTEINEAVDIINLRPNEEILNIGPYTHIATLVEFLVSKMRGFPVTYFTREPDDDDVLEDEIKKLKALGVRIKVLLAVPKFWIYVLKEVLEEMKNKPVLATLYSYLIEIENHGALHDIGTIDKAKLAAVCIQVRNKLGGYFSYGVSSSMKLDGAIVEIFGKLGITVIDVYGATELTGIISRNRLNDISPGSCGRIIGCLEYKLLDPHQAPGHSQPVGELLIKGPTLMHSYVGSEPGSHIDEAGFYHTGDIAWVDEERRVRLIGRRKELIQWSDGTYIDPQHLSNLLVRNIFVKDAMVLQVSPEDPFLSVYIYPDMKRIHKDRDLAKLLATGVPEDSILRKVAEDAIDYAQSISRLSVPLSKERIHILSKALERTPTHKIKFLFERERIHLSRTI